MGDWGPDPSMGRGNFDGEKGCPIVKYRDTLRSSVQKRHNRSRYRLGCRLGWAHGIMLDGGPDPPWAGAILGERGAHSKV